MQKIHPHVLGIGLPGSQATRDRTVFGYADGAKIPEILGVLDIPTRGDGTAKRIDVQALYDWLEKMDPSIGYIEAA